VNIRIAVGAAVLLNLGAAAAARASGHGPLFGAATPTLGRGGWSLDQAWTLRAGDDRQQMLRTMLSFGVTEDLQISGSFPLAMNDGRLPQARMMSAMSSDRDLEALVAYRVQRRPVGIGGRQESTVYLGGTGPLESQRDGFGAGPSIEAGAATGYASRAHYVWVGGWFQRHAERDGDRLGTSALVTAVYGFRPGAFRSEGRPDLRFFVETTAEKRWSASRSGLDRDAAVESIFVGPTALYLHKAVGVEGGVLFPAYQNAPIEERLRIAVNVAYFFWRK
jgi:hypothetical protein